MNNMSIKIDTLTIDMILEDLRRKLNSDDLESVNIEINKPVKNDFNTGVIKPGNKEKFKFILIYKEDE